MFTIRFTSTTTDVTLKAEKRGQARIITDAVKAAGMTPEVTVNKIVDLTVKPATPAQIAAREAAKKKTNKKK